MLGKELMGLNFGHVRKARKANASLLLSVGETEDIRYAAADAARKNINLQSKRVH